MTFEFCLCFGTDEKGLRAIIKPRIHIDNFADDSGLGCSLLNCLHIQIQTCKIALKFLAQNLDFVRFGVHCLLPSLQPGTYQALTGTARKRAAPAACSCSCSLSWCCANSGCVPFTRNLSLFLMGGGEVFLCHR